MYDAFTVPYWGESSATGNQSCSKGKIIADEKIKFFRVISKKATSAWVFVCDTEQLTGNRKTYNTPGMNFEEYRVRISK